MQCLPTILLLLLLLAVVLFAVSPNKGSDEHYADQLAHAAAGGIAGPVIWLDSEGEPASDSYLEGYQNMVEQDISALQTRANRIAKSLNQNMPNYPPGSVELLRDLEPRNRQKSKYYAGQLFNPKLPVCPYCKVEPQWYGPPPLGEGTPSSGCPNGCPTECPFGCPQKTTIQVGPDGTMVRKTARLPILGGSLCPYDCQGAEFEQPTYV